MNMHLEGMIEVVVGMTFVWFILSLATVQIQEWIASVLQWRSADLQNSIRGMFHSKKLALLFYDHPLIRSMSNMDQRSKPSYIPANQFSTVLLSMLMGAVTEPAFLVYGLYDLPEKLSGIKSTRQRKCAQKDLKHLFDVAQLADGIQDDRSLSDLLLATLEKEILDFGDRYPDVKEAAQKLVKDAQDNRINFEKAMKGLPALKDAATGAKSLLKGAIALGVMNPDFKTTLNTLLIGTENAIATETEFLNQIRSNIETWFNDSMDRIAGWYKRKAQLSTFLIGLFCAVLLNIDSIQMTTQLWREPMLREALNTNADLVLSQYSSEGEPGEIDAMSALQIIEDQYLYLPIGWNLHRVTLLPGQACSFAPASGDAFGFIQSDDDCLRPVGTQEDTNGWFWAAIKVAGFLITGMAAAQGSSFWFDMLSKIVNIRIAGKKPA